MLSHAVGVALSSLLLWSGPPTLPPDPGTPPTSAETSAEPSSPAPPDASPQAPAEVPSPAIAPAPSDPVEPPAPAVGPAQAPSVPAPALDPGPDLSPAHEPNYVLIRPPSWRGTGQFIASGALLAAAIAFQAGDSVLCGDCATGVVERIFLATSMGLAAGGGVTRGHADAYDDTALGRERPNTRRMLITGAALTGAGAVLGIVNEGMWWRCVFDASGPYALEPDPNDFARTFDCRYGLTRGLLDVASATTGVGLALLSWSLTYRRDAKAYERARVIGLRPSFGRDRWVLGVEGRF